MTNLPASTLFLFSTLVAMFSNQGIFANGQTLADKWAIEEPTVTFDSSTNTFTMSHVVDPSIVQANTAASIYEQDCLEGGNELIVADGIEATTTAVDTPGVATLTFDLNPGILSQNSDIFTNFPEERTAQMKICSRFKLQTNDASIEVNYLESIITVTFDLTAGFVLDAFSVESKERDDGTRDKAYEVEAYLCDPNVPSVSIDGTTFNQGSVISVCVTPTVEALNDGLFLERINEFNWVRGFIEQPAIQNNIQAANSLTQFECEPGAIYCTFSSVLYADFYKAPTLAPSSGPTYIGETQVPTSEATTEATAQSTTGGTICEGMNTTVEMDLDFSQSIVKQSDLQNGGELRFGNIGAIEGQAIDLLVTSSDYSNPNAENPAGKDPSGTFGEIAVKTLQGQPTSGRANFEFCLVQEDTDMPVTAASFQWYVNARACVCVCVCVCASERATAERAFPVPMGLVSDGVLCPRKASTGAVSELPRNRKLTASPSALFSFLLQVVFDIDNRNSAIGIHEKMTIDTQQASGYSLYPNIDQTEVSLSCENDGSAPPCDGGVRTVFAGTTIGNGQDNPTSPENLTEQQKRRSVVFTFTNTSCWTMEYHAYCPFEPEQNCRWYGASKFLFSGTASQIVEEGVTDCTPVGGGGSSTSGWRALGETSEGTGSVTASARDNTLEDGRRKQGRRELLSEKSAEVGGIGTATLSFGRRERERRRLLAKEGRVLQGAEPSSDIELTVGLIYSDDDPYGSIRTAGGPSPSAWGIHNTLACCFA
eukprot:CAMPEP_0201149222 /NCGR_PEP_ID=MMETSP0851-20130426/10575_1 /ASSEMBLY_ACC=CAM_ASM_000631 /TAXON_ID=183588 /ORGANISM="Pseudo-nitzschia fraudulenta, Strain WWA7" /LENGTH=765 /DNA_ID=CAMNT_0047425587 /DNA_START=1226 /DNA_END=3520 /DNA_ORIENTATION=+